jgi:hypothetical protein
MEVNEITTPAGNKIEQTTGPDPLKGGKRSAWMSHVKKTMRANKGKPLSAVLKMAAKSYKKTKRGGGGGITPASVGGRRSRKSKKNGSKKY